MTAEKKHTDFGADILALVAETPEPISQRQVGFKMNDEFFKFLNTNEVYNLLNHLFESEVQHLNFFRKAKGHELISLTNSSITSTLLKINGERFVLHPNFFELLNEKDVQMKLNTLFNDKARVVKNQEYWERIKKEDVEYNPFQTLVDYKKHVLENLHKIAAQEQKTFSFDEMYMKELLSELSAYFGGFHESLKRLEVDKLGNRKVRRGILLVGSKGIGKTSILKSFRKNPYQSFIVKTAREIARLVKDGHTEAYERLCYRWYTGHIKADYYGQKRLALMIDDIGTEDNVMTYGNVDNVISDLLFVRYENNEMRRAETPNLFMTTNLSIEQLETKYGSLVWDRMKEMLNIYVFDENLKSLRQ